jgi:hypothetical protein
MTISNPDCVFRYEPDTGLVLHRISHGRAQKDTVAGTKRPDGYSVIWFDGKLHLMHRLIWRIVTGSWPDKQIDHINRDRTDNRWCNLRCVEPRINVLNRGSYKRRPDNTSGVIGVHQCRKTGKWIARGSRCGTRQYLGIYSTRDQAVEARQTFETCTVGVGS